MSEQVLYKAKVACRIGGGFRRAGEVFPMPKFETTPSYLEEVPGEAPGAETPRRSRRERPKASPQGPMPADFPGALRD